MYLKYLGFKRVYVSVRDVDDLHYVELTDAVCINPLFVKPNSRVFRIVVQRGYPMLLECGGLQHCSRFLQNRMLKMEEHAEWIITPDDYMNPELTLKLHMEYYKRSNCKEKLLGVVQAPWLIEHYREYFTGLAFPNDAPFNIIALREEYRHEFKWFHLLGAQFQEGWDSTDVVPKP